MKKLPEQFRHITTDAQWDKTTDAILRELNKAEGKFPSWPVAINHGVDIVLEEAGEIAKACVDFTWGRAPKSEIKKELIQTAAMCIRMLTAMEPKTDD